MPFSLFAGKAKESIALHIDQNLFLSSSNEQIKSLIPGAEFHILESSRGFELKLSEGELAYEDDLFTAPASIQILSGRDFTINGTTLAASIRTNRAEVAGREDMKSITARSIIGLIILFEILFITVLPSQLSGKDNFKREYLMEEISTSLDSLRRKIQGDLKGSAKNNTIKSGILKDLKTSLDSLANDLRLKPKSFSLKKLEQTTETLTQCQRLLQKLNNSPLVNNGLIQIDKQKILDNTFTK